MKRPRRSTISSRNKKVACAVSAAALMLGVSSAATVGLHFQVNYCDSQDYSGFPVTLTAFGISPSSWQNLTEMDTGYGCGSYPQPGVGDYFTLQENGIGFTNTSAGLNPLPSGSLNVTWSAYTANYAPFVGYGGAPPYYFGPGGCAGALSIRNAPISGEQQVYASFLRDGLNFGPGGANNDQPGYLIDVTGLRSVFPSSPFVVELVASADSTQVFTNAFVVDVAHLITNSVTYPAIPSVVNSEGTVYYQGTGGGLSTVSAAITNTDEIQIFSATPFHQQGGTTLSPGSNYCGTICGFMVTDKPVVTMSPQPIPVAGPGDSVLLNPYAIGVPPLSYQWRLNGQSIAGATNSSFAISNVNKVAFGGNYDLVVTNLYGAATSQVSAVTVDRITHSPTKGIVYDSNPANAQHNGVNIGATWEGSYSDGTITRTGVMDFAAEETNGVTVEDSSSFDGAQGTITFWMQSTGVDLNANGSVGASIFCRTTGSDVHEFLILQQEGSYGQLSVLVPGFANNFTSVGGVSDGKWHFVAVTFDQSASGGVGLFIDGRLDTTNSNAESWAWPAGEDPLEIGYTTDTSWKDYNGLLDDFRYYTTILTPSQIASIDNSGALVDTNDLQLQFSFTAAPGAATILTWKENSAVLQSAPCLDGPWVDVTGASSPYTIAPSATQQFFRYRYVPQSLVTNPYLM